MTAHWTDEHFLIAVVVNELSAHFGFLILDLEPTPNVFLQACLVHVLNVVLTKFGIQFRGLLYLILEHGDAGVAYLEDVF